SQSTHCQRVFLNAVKNLSESKSQDPLREIFRYAQYDVVSDVYNEEILRLHFVPLRMTYRG
ncbi:MAG: hypothetical protein IIW97_06245, partial [Alistipes sp.]|nr:hypothetical protein [Alistipes sp.]